MIRGAPEAVVEIDVAARRIDVVAPEQARDAPARPHAFGRAGGMRKLRRRLVVFGFRAGRRLLLGLGRVLCLLLAFWLLLALLRLFGRLLFAAGLLGEGRLPGRRARAVATRAEAVKLMQCSMEVSPQE